MIDPQAAHDQYLGGPWLLCKDPLEEPYPATQHKVIFFFILKDSINITHIGYVSRDIQQRDDKLNWKQKRNDEKYGLAKKFETKLETT